MATGVCILFMFVHADLHIFNSTGGSSEERSVAKLRQKLFACVYVYK